MKHESYEEVVELYTLLEQKLGDVLKLQSSDLMDEPKFVKVYRIILGYSLENFASECNLDSNLLKNIENGEGLEYNIATKIYDTISRLIKNHKLQKSSIDILSKNYLVYEIIKSKNLHTLANRQVRYLSLSKPNRLVLYFYIIFFLIIFGAQFSIFISLALLLLILLFIIYYTFIKTQFFLWDNDIISHFICLLLKNSFSESLNEIKKIFRVLASRLDDEFIQYHDPYWYLRSIRKELAEIVCYYLYPNINEANKGKILDYLEKISIFLSTYSIEQYEEIKKLIADVKANFNEVRPIEQKQTTIEKLIKMLNIRILPLVGSFSDILIKTAPYWILALIVSSAAYILTKNLQFVAAVIAFLGLIFSIHNSNVTKPK